MIDIDEHPILFVICVVINCSFVLMVVIGLPLFICYKANEGTYEYEDLDGNTGYAPYCENNRGNLTCLMHDNTIISVKKYKRID